MAESSFDFYIESDDEAELLVPFLSAQLCSLARRIASACRRRSRARQDKKAHTARENLLQHPNDSNDPSRVTVTRRGFLACLHAPAIALCARKNGWQRFVATAYSTEDETASGKQTREGRTVAADPAVLPVGTTIQVEGAGPYSGEYVVHDTGPKIKGREIDIFIDDAVEAKRFGRKAVRIRVLTLQETSVSKR
jgi:3D (Asp-Asp-Asp) domain-containing protein